MPPEFDPYYKWLGIAPQEQPPNHYRLLGVNVFENDADVISSAADRQMAHVRSFQTGEHSAISQQLLNQISAARICLLRADTKLAYDAALRARLAAPVPWRATVVAPVTAARPVRATARKHKPAALIGWAAVAASAFVLAVVVSLATRSRPGQVAVVKPPQPPVIISSATPPEHPEPEAPTQAGQDAQPEPKPEPSVKLGDFAGTWAIKYHGSHARTYTIDADGSVVFPEEKRQSKLFIRDGMVLLDFRDGKLERLELAGSKLRVEHFHPASRYPDGIPRLGLGERQRLEPQQVVQNEPRPSVGDGGPAKSGDKVVDKAREAKPDASSLAVPVDAKSVAQAAQPSQGTAPPWPEITRHLNDLSQWKVSDGDWKTENGRIIGSDASMLAFNHPMPEDFTLEVTIDVISGMRPRIYLPGFHVGNEGYQKVFSLRIAKGAEGPGFPYANKQPMKVRVVAQGPNVQLYVNDSLVGESGQRKAKKSELRISGGDRWSRGSTAFSTFTIGPPPDRVSLTRASRADDEPPAKQAKDAAGATASDWLPDLPAAQAKAQAEGKDVLLLFDSSEQGERSGRSARELLLHREIRAQVESRYVLAFIDLSSEGAGKAASARRRRNSKLAAQFLVREVPTVIAIDAQGRTYGRLRGLEADPPALMAMLTELRSVRDQLQRIIGRAQRGSLSESLQALREGLKLLEDRELLRYHAPLLEEWLGLARRHDADNAQGVYEWAFADGWLVRVTAISPPDAERFRPLLSELDAWKRDHTFRDSDRAARLHLVAAMALLAVRDSESAGKYAEAGLGYRPKDAKTLHALKSLQMVAQGIIGSGTGFLVAADGHLLTNHHVVAGAARLLVCLPDRKEPLPAKVIAVDAKQDMALLKIDLPAGVRPAPLGVVADDLRRGAPIGAFGYPLGGMVGAGLKLTTGVVSAPAEQSAGGMILLDCRVNPGNSGGPLCDRYGNVVGMVTAKSLSSATIESYGMALPSPVLCDFLTKYLPAFKPRKAAPAAAKQWDEIDRRVSPSVVLVLRGSEAKRRPGGSNVGK